MVSHNVVVFHCVWVRVVVHVSVLVFHFTSVIVRGFSLTVEMEVTVRALQVLDGGGLGG